MNAYDLLRGAHVILAITSISGFIVRGVWRLMASPLLAHKWVRIAPHVIDSLLLIAGIALVAWSRTYPWEHPWLAAKMMALIVYIGLGVVTLRFARTRAQQTLAFLAAIACFGYMLAVAVTRSPVPL